MKIVTVSNAFQLHCGMDEDAILHEAYAQAVAGLPSTEALPRVKLRELPRTGDARHFEVEFVDMAPNMQALLERQLEDSLHLQSHPRRELPK